MWFRAFKCCFFISFTVFCYKIIQFIIRKEVTSQPFKCWSANISSPLSPEESSALLVIEPPSGVHRRSTIQNRNNNSSPHQLEIRRDEQELLGAGLNHTPRVYLKPLLRNSRCRVQKINTSLERRIDGNARGSLNQIGLHLNIISVANFEIEKEITHFLIRSYRRHGLPAALLFLWSLFGHACLAQLLRASSARRMKTSNLLHCVYVHSWGPLPCFALLRCLANILSRIFPLPQPPRKG